MISVCVRHDRPAAQGRSRCGIAWQPGQASLSTALGAAPGKQASRGSGSLLDLDATRDPPERTQISSARPRGGRALRQVRPPNGASSWLHSRYTGNTKRNESADCRGSSAMDMRSPVVGESILTSDGFS